MKKMNSYDFEILFVELMEDETLKPVEKMKLSTKAVSYKEARNHALEVGQAYMRKVDCYEERYLFMRLVIA